MIDCGFELALQVPDSHLSPSMKKRPLLFDDDEATSAVGDFETNWDIPCLEPIIQLSNSHTENMAVAFTNRQVPLWK